VYLLRSRLVYVSVRGNGIFAIGGREGKIDECDGRKEEE